jgi:hypothetical protein
MGDAGTNGASHAKPAPPPDDAAEPFLERAKQVLLPIFVREISEELFQPARGAELKQRVEQIVDAWLVREQVPIGRQLRLALLQSIFADMERVQRERSG